MLVTELIRRGALYHRERTALIFGDRAMSFAEVESLSNRIAQVLGGALGLGKGSPVCLLWDNCLLGMPADFACVKAGLVRTPLNGRLSLEEHLAIIDKNGAGTLLYGASQTVRGAAL